MPDPRLVWISLLLLAACATFPEVDRAEQRYGGVGNVPQLVPLEGVLAGAEGAVATEASQQALDARAAGLRARAATLRQN